MGPQRSIAPAPAVNQNSGFLKTKNCDQLDSSAGAFQTFSTDEFFQHSPFGPSLLMCSEKKRWDLLTPVSSPVAASSPRIPFHHPGICDVDLINARRPSFESLLSSSDNVIGGWPKAAMNAAAPRTNSVDDPTDVLILQKGGNPWMYPSESMYTFESTHSYQLDNVNAPSDNHFGNDNDRRDSVISSVSWPSARSEPDLHHAPRYQDENKNSLFSRKGSASSSKSWRDSAAAGDSKRWRSSESPTMKDKVQPNSHPVGEKELKDIFARREKRTTYMIRYYFSYLETFPISTPSRC
jgi:hypothetical protein